MAHRAKLPSVRLFISPSLLTAYCTCFVPELGQNIYFHCRRKSKRPLKIVGLFRAGPLWPCKTSSRGLPAQCLVRCFASATSIGVVRRGGEVAFQSANSRLFPSC